MINYIVTMANNRTHNLTEDEYKELTARLAQGMTAIEFQREDKPGILINWLMVIDVQGLIRSSVNTGTVVTSISPEQAEFRKEQEEVKRKTDLDTIIEVATNEED